MIDLSDDLWTSVGLMSRAGNVGVAVRLDGLPISPPLREFCRLTGRDPIEMAVCGGEDYELLFATSAEPQAVKKVLRNAGLTTSVTDIGRVGGRGVRWLDSRGKSVSIRWRPFEHFHGESS
jgi:thiamine-monophosphate kinase